MDLYASGLLDSLLFSSFDFITLLLLAYTSPYSSVLLLILCPFAFHISFHPSPLDHFPFNSDSYPVFRLARLLILRLVDFGRPPVDYKFSGCINTGL
jgi:hypothetical protein